MDPVVMTKAISAYIWHLNRILAWGEREGERKE